MRATVYWSAAAMACVLLASAPLAAGVGCGERLAAGGSCTDQQCTLNVSNFCVHGVAKHGNCTTDHMCYIAMTCQGGTCQKKPDAAKNLGVGLAASLAAVVCFGSSFVPVKRYKRYAGDGVFAQFLMCFGRFFVGCIILLTRTNQQFYPFAALGGMFWAGGNAISVPIIQCVGMALGIAIWGTTNMILGWASGAFGLWGVKKETPGHAGLAYTGVVFSFISIVLFVFVEPYYAKKADAEDDADAEPALNDAVDGGDDGKAAGASVNSQDEASRLLQPAAAADGTATDAAPGSQSTGITIADVIGKRKARIIGVSLALLAGALFGLSMDPAQHLMTHYDEKSSTDASKKFTPDGLDYVFSFNCGAIVFAFAYLFVYRALRAVGVCPSDKYFHPVTHDKIIIPCFLNGMIGSCGSAAWFVANQNLGLMVSFPIIAAGPGIVSTLWGVLLFKEIRGRRNFIILGGAFAAAVLSAVFSSLGK
jgi:glucose uptake protein GlcU